MKSKGLAIIFGLMPGAGHMYLGKMKRGMTLMLLFWGSMALAMLLGIGALTFAMPIVWFYAFFDNLNLISLTPEELKNAPDPFCFGLLEGVELKKIKIFETKNVMLGWALIILGVIMLYNTFASSIVRSLATLLESLGASTNWLWSIYYNIPQLVIAILIIVLGIRFMHGGKKKSDDLRQYIGENSETKS
ncbi:MAG: hypothetical protein ACOX6P_00780 [Candidatus Merdivicinus sp.]